MVRELGGSGNVETGPVFTLHKTEIGFIHNLRPFTHQVHVIAIETAQEKGMIILSCAGSIRERIVTLDIEPLRPFEITD